MRTEKINELIKILEGNTRAPECNEPLTPNETQELCIALQELNWCHVFVKWIVLLGGVDVGQFSHHDIKRFTGEE